MLPYFKWGCLFEIFSIVLSHYSITLSMSLSGFIASMLPVISKGFLTSIDGLCEVWGKFDVIDPIAAIDFIDTNFAEWGGETAQGSSLPLRFRTAMAQ